MAEFTYKNAGRCFSSLSAVTLEHTQLIVALLMYLHFYPTWRRKCMMMMIIIIMIMMIMMMK
jgi:hypothetical protein